jgi:hypothetical protein
MKRSSHQLAQLSILVPTYRFDARCRYTLAALAAMASDEIKVLIGDNSGNKAKWDFLRRLRGLHSNVEIFCHKENIGAGRNWRFLLNQSRLPFYIFVGDDDVCTPDYIEASLRAMVSHDDASAAAGRFLMSTSTGALVTANRERLEGSPAERCVNFRIGGGNGIPNSMARRSAIEPYLAYAANHPLKASFFDWMMAYVLLAQGKYYTFDRGIYLYDSSNWDSGNAYWVNNAKFYLAAGLPESFTWFHELYWAIELVHFFRGSYWPVDDPEQRYECARSFHADRMSAFRGLLSSAQNVNAIEQLLAGHPAASDALRALLDTGDFSHPRLFQNFAELLARFDRICAAAYLDYVTSSIERVGT